jgi:hypothetical protein
MALNVFISYAHEDRAFRQELDKHLSNLKKQDIIHSWHDGDILPGTPWRSQIEDHLASADLILLLISSDFMASDFCYSVQLQQAIARHRARQAHVIPILLRPTDWQGAPFSDLLILPTAAKAVTLWRTHDEAFADVVQGIKRVLFATPTEDPPHPVAPAQSSPIQPALVQATSQLAQSQPPKPKIPGVGEHFLSSGDRAWIINIVVYIIDLLSVTEMKNLLRGILPDSLIGNINFRETSSNIAATMVGRLEARGALNPPDNHTHALGAFLKRVIEDDAIGYDAQVKIVTLIFHYTLIADLREIKDLSKRFNVSY